MAKMKPTFADRVYDTINNLVMTLVLTIILYPLIYIVSSSFSSTKAIMAGRVILWPVDFSLEGYKTIFEYDAIWRGYANTIFYTFFGTIINIVVTIMAAYPLSRTDLFGRRVIMMLFAFTMMFNGGLIPTYILMRNLGLINTRWAMLLPGALSVWNVIITRTYFQTTIPEELLDAAQIDGCNDFRFIVDIVLPLSGAIVAVISLYYGVGHWNAFFNAFIYLSNKKLFPLQVILREILIVNSFDQELLGIEADIEEMAAKESIRELLKYSLIIVSSLPVLCAYPFVQKFFVKGVMIGSIKG